MATRLAAPEIATLDPHKFMAVIGKRVGCGVATTAVEIAKRYDAHVTAVDIGPYLVHAERRGLTIAFTVETHLHADFVSGSRELAALGAQVVAPTASQLAFPARGLGHCDELDLGGLTLRGLATPGHTPEHLSYLLLDGTRRISASARSTSPIAHTSRSSAHDRPTHPPAVGLRRSGR